MARLLLCVDDRPQMLQVRKESLEEFGFAVVTATTALTALRILEEMEVSVVLLDYKLDGLDAEAVAFHVKQHYPNKPVLLLSAYSHLPERILWLVDDYIMRSEPLERLVDTIERVGRGNSHQRGATA